MMRLPLHLLLSVILLSISAVTLSAAEPLIYYVAPDGNDGSPGTKAKPFATLARARDAIRSVRKNDIDVPATVIIKPGMYRLEAALELGHQDSDTLYRSENTRPATLTGGIGFDLSRLPALQDENILKRLSQDVRTKVRVIDLRKHVPDWVPDAPWPDAFRGYAGWPEVFIGGTPLRLARWPNNGYATVGKVVDSGSKPRLKETPDRPGAFVFKESEPATWDTSQEIFLGGYWCYAWYDEILRVGHIDREKKMIRFVAPHHYGIGGQSKGRYYALNVLETLDQPGEYVYDRKAGRIYLIPPDDGNDCMVSLLQSPLITLNGASEVRFENLQLEAGRGIGITISNSTDTVIENCVIRSFPQFGVKIQGGKRCGVVHSELYGMGKGGISLDGGDRKTLVPGNHFVTDCEIHNYARLVQTYQPAVRLSGVSQRVAFNFIHDAPHQAIGFNGNDHLIENNRIERVCLDTGDAGAIYCGRDWTLQGNVIQKNWFSDLGKSIHHNNWAIYPDDQASGITARHNIVMNSPSGFLFGGGRDSIIEGNLFVTVGNWPIRFDKRGISWKGKHEETLQAKLATVPCDEEPWRSRYPTLVGLSANPQRNWPENNLITGNIAVNSSPDNIDSKVKECGRVQDTVRIKSEWSPRLENGKVIFPDGGPGLPVNFKKLTVGPRPKTQRR